ncbi:MAG: transporter [Sulfuricaulis sp.]
MKTQFMETVKARNLLLAMLLAGGVLFNPLLTQAAEKPDTATPIPATSEAVWQSIDKETERLAAVIQAGKFDEVHHRALAIRDLVAALPTRSGNMPAEKLAQVKANTKFVATLAARLDTAGDAKDKAATEANFQKLKDV